MLKSGRSAFALCVAVLVLSGAQHADAIFLSRLMETFEDATTSGINSLPELDNQTPAQKVFRLKIGVGQYLSTGPCRLPTIGVLTGCAPQFLYLTNAFGVNFKGRLFRPSLTAKKMTRSFLKGMPLPPSRLCCKSSITFQERWCACNPEVILAYRNLGIFDPLQTLDFAEFLYGEQCGAKTVLADDCPNGSPFDIVGGRKMF